MKLADSSLVPYPELNRPRPEAVDSEYTYAYVAARKKSLS
jgi:hypothetical protein